MSIITMPASLLVGRMVYGVQRFDHHEMSPESGDSSDRLLGVPRWLLTIEAPDDIDAATMDVWRTMLVKLRGRVNHLAAWDVHRIAPRGTMRGTLTTSGTLAQGATSMTITGGAGQASTTLKGGDWLQIGSGLTGQLVMVTDDATANGSGVITVNFEHPIRLAAGYANGTPVTWDKALGHYKMTSTSVQWVRAGGPLEGGAGLSLMEQW